MCKKWAGKRIIAPRLLKMAAICLVLWLWNFSTYAYSERQGLNVEGLRKEINYLLILVLKVEGAII